MAALMRSALAVACAMLLGAGVTACSDETGGTPESPAQPPSSSVNDVPKVSNPLNADPFLSRPCDLIGKQVVAELGGQGAGENDTSSEMAKKLTGPNCSFDSDRGDFDVAIQIVHRDKASESVKGIAGVYSDNSRFAQFEPREIPGHQGYPATIAREEIDISDGHCPVYVGIADDLTFVASVTNESNPDAACPEAEKLAASVLDTLKKGA